MSRSLSTNSSPFTYNNKVKRTQKIVLIVLGLIIFLGFTLFFVYPVQITGHSMEPTYDDGSIYLVLNKALTSINRGDVVTYVYADSSGFYPTFVSRIVGLPGDKVRITDGKVYINDKLYDEPYLPSDTNTPVGTLGPLDLEKGVTVSSGAYFLLSDKRSYARDSRSHGFIHEKALKAKVFLKLPFKGSPSL